MAKIQKKWFGQAMDLPKTVPEPETPVLDLAPSSVLALRASAVASEAP